MHKRLKSTTKKTVIGTIGGLLLCVGIVAIPYPGPGWLIVFAALSILATEFEWAYRIHKYGRKKYDAWQKWLSHQNNYVKSFFWCATATLVVLTIWIMNGYGIMAGWFGIDWDWARSPFFGK